jgi:hypothetical protein
MAGRVHLCGAPVTFVMRTIRKAAEVCLSGILIVPLWKGARFWTFAFRDGMHLNGIFNGMHLICMKTFVWDILREDRVAG